MSDLILKDFTEKLTNIGDLDRLEELRLEFLGKKGLVSQELATLGKLDPTQRQAKGKTLNLLKNQILAELQNKKTELANQALEKQLNSEALDVTLPSRNLPTGSLHPITQVTAEIVDIFANLGFSAVDGPEIEDDHHNFTALNIAENHPARQMHDTFYLQDLKYLLRTHTSSVQIRTMENGKPPFAIIAPGKTYRSDSDATHTPMFHQIEALYIAENVSMANLKYCIKSFTEKFFGEKIDLRFRSSFFPFTEPSAEVDIGCKMHADHIDLKGSGDYLEIMGCGMVHPNVLANVGIDPEKYNGFALGMGIERIAMLKYGMRDLRQFFNPKPDWSACYNFKPHQIA